MEIVKTVGVIQLATENGNFFLIREKKEQSQNFPSAKEVWRAFMEHKVRWHHL